ncbi:hypothetical protein [Lacrimispora celerecrescens]|uniref:Uncharacterized protein n=1 Tax=Lacrimispora celerecrescens TaxID=29354 RepID=A0A084JRV8_9FIRM|nr:hypothetical protein [Lacrimispora celerecrescens]KEZ91692.1 hypothetical protein IO98_00480 [Lacrimispora celerecrescens]
MAGKTRTWLMGNYHLAGRVFFVSLIGGNCRLGCGNEHGKADGKINLIHEEEKDGTRGIG